MNNLTDHSIFLGSSKHHKSMLTEFLTKARLCCQPGSRSPFRKEKTTLILLKLFINSALFWSWAAWRSKLLINFNEPTPVPFFFFLVQCFFGQWPKRDVGRHRRRNAFFLILKRPNHQPFFASVICAFVTSFLKGFQAGSSSAMNTENHRQSSVAVIYVHYGMLYGLPSNM